MRHFEVTYGCIGGCVPASHRDRRLRQTRNVRLSQSECPRINIKRLSYGTGPNLIGRMVYTDHWNKPVKKGNIITSTDMSRKASDSEEIGMIQQE